MGDPALPQAFEDAVPTETMKATSGRTSSPSRSPILEQSQQPQTYSTILSSNSNPIGNQNTVEVSHESDEENRRPPDEPHGWLGKRIWMAIQRWERDHLELVLENKQSVARDHLGTEA